MSEEKSSESLAGKPHTETSIDAPAQSYEAQNPPPQLTDNLHQDNQCEATSPEGKPRSEKNWSNRIGVATLLINTFICIIYWGQLRQMKKATEAATQASQTASATLQEMKTGSGATDTHRLAVAAGEQAEASIVYAQAAKVEATNSGNLAASTLKQVGIAERSERILEAELMPYVLPVNMDLAEPLVTGKPIRIANNFINEGGTVAFDVQSLTTTEIRPPGQDPVFEFKSTTGSRASIGAKNTFDSMIFIPPRTQMQLDWIFRGLAVVYVVGEIQYSDIFHRLHHTQYCMVLDPRSGRFNGCKYQGKSD